MERRGSIMRRFYGINSIIENEEDDEFYDEEDEEREWCD
jgi:hypothetical protein